MTIPNELQRSAPRDVSLTRAGWRAILLPGTLAIFIAVGMQAPNSDHSTGVPFVLGRVAWLWDHPLFDLGTILLGATIGWWRYRRQSHLLTYGRAAVASVTDFEKRLWLGVLRRRLRVHCEFRLLNGSVCRTTVEVPRSGEIPDWDEEIVIVYDADEPKKAMWYPARTLTVRT